MRALNPGLRLPGSAGIAVVGVGVAVGAPVGVSAPRSVSAVKRVARNAIRAAAVADPAPLAPGRGTILDAMAAHALDALRCFDRRGEASRGDEIEVQQRKMST